MKRILGGVGLGVIGAVCLSVAIGAQSASQVADAAMEKDAEIKRSLKEAQLVPAK